MLPNADYEKINAKNIGFSLSDLEQGTLESCTEFLEVLKSTLRDEKITPAPEILIAHLCAYLGTAMTVHTVHDAENLEPYVVELIRQQAVAAYQCFKQYPINSITSQREQRKLNLKQLYKITPGGILSQTMGLNRVIIDILEELNSGQSTTNDQNVFCSQDALAKITLYLSGKRCAQWRKELAGLSDNYVINQLAIQIGWTIGYLIHLSGQAFDEARYFDYGIPVIRLYHKHIYQLIKSFAEAKHSEEQAEIKGLMDDIHELSEKTHSQVKPAVTDFQKQYLIAFAGIEKTLIDLITEHCPIKVILMSSFYFWFTLALPLYNKKPEEVEQPFTHMTEIIHLVKNTAKELPEANLTPEIVALNEKMQQLKQYIPSPEKLDQVPQSEVLQQTTRVNTAIHTITGEYLQQNIDPEAIANALFTHWLRLSVFFGVSEKDWQKMNYYLIDIIKTVKQYIVTKIDK